MGLLEKVHSLDLVGGGENDKSSDKQLLLGWKQCYNESVRRARFAVFECNAYVSLMFNSMIKGTVQHNSN